MQNQTVNYVQFVYIAHFISGYTSTLMQETLSAVKGASDEPVPCLPAVQPPPLCSGFIHLILGLGTLCTGWTEKSV